MTVEEYRQRMIRAFHNAGCDELIAVCVLPTEKEFEHLEWLLRSHYKKEPKTDYKAFVEWVVSEIFDENWEYNKGSFAELACRKLAKLGIVRAKDGEWELVESQAESEDKK